VLLAFQNKTNLPISDLGSHERATRDGKHDQ